MPNWCSNNVVISGPENSINDFFEACDYKFCFSKFIPDAPDNSDSMFPYVEVWGTKWDIDEIEVSDDDTSLNFDTAWSPPIKFFQTVSLKYPDLTFSMAFAECGVGYYGTAIVKNGEVREEIAESTFFVQDEDSDEMILLPKIEKFLEENNLNAGG